MSQKRILMATDVPFWRNETGAQQRMLHLVLGLSDPELGDRCSEVVTFFIGLTKPEDEQRASALGLNVRFHSSDQAPESIGKRIKWHMEGTIHLVRQAFGGRKDIKNVDQPLTLADFNWPWAERAFAECVDQIEPHAIIFQYVTMSYLLDSLSSQQRQSIKCIVDTHDILSSRQTQFEEFGYRHWIDVGVEEEAAELGKFDVILAIIDQERPEFESLLNESSTANVLTVGHSLSPVTRHISDESRNPGDAASRSLMRIGYLGSSNHSNGHALVKFIRQVWRPLQKQNAEVELFVAGSICDWLMFHEESRFSSDESMSLWIELSTDPKVHLMGKVDRVDSFYQNIDVAINPVEFGTGLKIKTCEAFAYGVPSIVTQNGAASVPPEAADALIVCDSIKQMAPAIFALSIDRQRRRQLQDSAFEIAANVFSNESAYGRLIDLLQTG